MAELGSSHQSSELLKIFRKLLKTCFSRDNKICIHFVSN